MQHIRDPLPLLLLRQEQAPDQRPALLLRFTELLVEPDVQNREADSIRHGLEKRPVIGSEGGRPRRSERH